MYRISRGSLGGRRTSDSDSRSANGSADFAIGTVTVGLFFVCARGGASLFARPSDDVRRSEGVESEALADALRVCREGGLRAAPRDLVYRNTHKTMKT